MLLSHAVLLAEARSYVAALADSANGFDATLEYERVLLQLDHLHGGHIPPITVVPTGNRQVLYDVAEASIGGLVHHGIDRFELAICRSMLATAWHEENRS
jgi:hypothetical protein